MTSNKKNVYVLGTGLSHDGSACLLKDGKICVAIEKERITRVKHDGGNDTDAIKYCLETEGIELTDLSVIVQNANFGNFEFGNKYFQGSRLFSDELDVPIVTISHHLAHAYYALGTSPYDQTAILVLDGCGSLYDECTDLKGGTILPNDIPEDLQHLYAEKDSFYIYKDNKFQTICKDFSPFGFVLKGYPMHPDTTKHSIGGVYMAASSYCFTYPDDAGKLMGLAPYGKPDIYNDSIFELKDGRVFVNYTWMSKFRKPSRSIENFWMNFQYYADIAYWVQRETEKAILYLLRSRRELTSSENLSYTGGVALNAVANSLILKEKLFKNIYFTPAAGDNGLSIGCAYYGWLESLKNERVTHNGISSFGKIYSKLSVRRDLLSFVIPNRKSHKLWASGFFKNLALFLNYEAVTRENYCIQFILSDIGIYFISISKERVLVLQESEIKPDCILSTDSITFIKMLKCKNHFFESVFDDKLSVTGDLGYFASVIRINELHELLEDEFVKNTEVEKLYFSEEHDVTKRAAELLAEGKIIGWFQDGCEFGPRALGYRSILADPRKEDVQKIINNKIKFREDFRPFAPAILEENVSEYFDFVGKSPYMIMIARVNDDFKNVIPGVVHIDNSSRIQTVSSSANEKFHKLIKEFKALTGVPILLNTSFNKKGMPIVETPNQALSFFFECELDCLVINNFVVYKHSNTGGESEQSLYENSVQVIH